MPIDMNAEPRNLPSDDWPIDGLEQAVRCPACGGRKRAPWHTDLADDTFYCAPGRWTLVRCLDCDSGYLDPRPKASSLGLAYAKYYTHGAETVRPDSPAKAAVRRLLVRISESYVSSFLRRQQTGSRFMAWGVRLVPPARELIDARYRHLRKAQANARLLDVGCGDGDFLSRASLLGWRVEGVDFDAAAVSAARSRGLDVQIGDIDAYTGQADVFDVITCNHVIEHVENPRHLLDCFHRLLKPGGQLWLETPNASSLGHAVFGRFWRGLEAPRHLVVFSHSSLVKLVEQAGFRVEQTTPWNFQHIRYVFAASTIIANEASARNDASAPQRRLSVWRALLIEAVRPRRREFVLVRARKQSAQI